MGNGRTIQAGYCRAAFAEKLGARRVPALPCRYRRDLLHMELAFWDTGEARKMDRTGARDCPIMLLRDSCGDNADGLVIRSKRFLWSSLLRGEIVAIDFA